MNDLIVADYTRPAPAWDYSKIWHWLQESKTDKAIKQRQDTIGQQLNMTRQMMDS